VHPPDPQLEDEVQEKMRALTRDLLKDLGIPMIKPEEN
jgi:hypothetical protein